MLGLGLKQKVAFSHINGPGKLIPLSLVINFIQWHLHVLAPTNQVTGGEKRNKLEDILTIFDAQ